MEGSRLLLLSFLPVITLLISTQLQPVSAGGFIEIQFLKYMNPEGKRKSGGCCDGVGSWCSSECDHYFVVCIDDVNKATEDTIAPCKYNKTTTLPVKNKNIIDFSELEDDIKLPNPLRIRLNPFQKDISLKIAVYDKDTGSDDDVDFMRLDLGSGRNHLGAGEERIFNITHRTAFEVKVKMGCDRDWYNDACGQLCRPPSSGQHYNCDRETGNKICTLGWEGPMCSTRTSRCTEDSCENQGRCTTRGNTQHCECSSEFTGARCEIDACDSKCEPGTCSRTGAGRDGYSCRCASGYDAIRTNQGEGCQLRPQPQTPRPGGGNNTPRPTQRPLPETPRPNDKNTPRPTQSPTPQPTLRPYPDERPTPRPTERPYPDEDNNNRLPNPNQPGPDTGRPGPRPRPRPEERTDIVDCDTIKKKGYQYSTGLYNIQLGRARKKVMVYCEMRSDGGYTHIMHRGGSGTLNFYRGWYDYKEGFGEPGDNSEHWLGLENMHLLTEQRRYKLRIDMKKATGRSLYAEYTDFKVGSEISKYRLTISGYRGTAGDALGLSEYDERTRARSHNNMQFSTYEQDNDRWYQGNCARDFKSGWWFNQCYAANLNGKYRHEYDPYNPSACPDDVCIQWRTIPEYQDFSLKEVTMKIIPY